MKVEATKKTDDLTKEIPHRNWLGKSIFRIMHGQKIVRRLRFRCKK